MESIRHDCDKRITLYPLVCMHIGALQADEDFIREHVARIAADPDGRWVYLGDGGECVTKASVGSLYEQILSPDEQIDRVVELLEPIRGKGLLGVSGNHDRRISKLSGMDWTKTLCLQLGIPYMGIAAFMRLAIHPHKNKNVVHSKDMLWHHGTDSSSILGTKVNKAKKLEELVDADAVFSAHSHICLDVQPTYKAFLDRRGKLKWREVRNFICGCAYDSRSGYAEEKGYSPLLPAYLAVTYETKKKDDNWVVKTSCQMWRKQV